MKYSITVEDQDHTLEVIRDCGVSYWLDGAPFEADVVEVEQGVFSLLIGGKSFQARVVHHNRERGECTVSLDDLHYLVAVRNRRRYEQGGLARSMADGKQSVVSLMPGKVIRILVSEGETVEGGQGLVVVEAMKMQNEIKCLKPGAVLKIHVRPGQTVTAGEALVTVE